MNLFLPMLGVGLVTGVHCVAMCGTMVLTYAVRDDTAGPWYRRMAPHIAYQSAKLFSYTAVGLALGALGAAFDLAGARGWVSVLAGVFMVLLGLQMTGRFPWLRRFTLRPPKALASALGATRKRARSEAGTGRASLRTPLTFGLLGGLMPCGPLQSAQLAAAGAGSAAAGALTMLGFGLGTMPLLLAFGAVSGTLSRRFRERMMTLGAIVVMVLGLVMLDRGLALVGSPVTFQTLKAAIVGETGSSSAASAPGGYARGADGVVRVPLVIENTRYAPSTVTVPAGERVRLVVDRREDNACSAQLAVPQLGVLADLKANGTTVVDLPPSKAGAYTLTCGMGMMSGRLVVGGGAGGVSPALIALLLGIALAVAVLGRWLWRTSARPSNAELALLATVLAAALTAGLAVGGVFTR